MGDFMIGGVSVIALVLGIVELSKRLGLQGKGCEILAVSLGAFFVALAQAIEMGLVPEVALPWITVAVIGIGGGLAAMGLYDFSKRFFNK